MTGTLDNWTAVFKDAAGADVFAVGGYVSPVTMDIKTGDTFLNQALVKLEEAELGRSARGPGVFPLRDSWDKVVVNANTFGVVNYEVARTSVRDEQIKWAEQVAEKNLNPAP